MNFFPILIDIKVKLFSGFVIVVVVYKCLFICFIVVIDNAAFARQGQLDGTIWIVFVYVKYFILLGLCLFDLILIQMSWNEVKTIL